MKSIAKKSILYTLVFTLVAIPLSGCGLIAQIPNLPPTADFTYSPSAPTTDDTVAFTDESTDIDGNVVSWAWDFGDGGISMSQNPSHVYHTPGTYTATLIAIDDDGASSTATAEITVSSPLPGIGKWDAIEILVGEIIPPAASDERISAFMLSQPLQQGDVVTSAGGGNYPIAANTWFIFIDDAPQAFYSHATRYVFMDASAGTYDIVNETTYDIVNETWPPMINNFSMWDTKNLGRGHLIEVWSVLDNPAPISSGVTTAPSGDYGDAPDGQLDVYYGNIGHFPTLFNTTNSHFGRPGVHTLNVGEEILGLNVSAEVDAIDPNDPDGVPNLVDADSDERMYVIMEKSQARLAFTVTVSLNAPDVTRYANALIDFDQSGNWSTGSYGVEWVVVNLEVDVAPGTSETILTPLFPWGNQAQIPSPVWMRVALTREKVDETLFTNVGGWDGSGQFTYGEIEDHFVFLIDNPPPPPPPPDGDGDGNGNGNGNGNGPPPPGPEKGPCGYDINYYVLIINLGDMYKHIAQGIPITQAASSSMTSVAQSQNYTSVGNLGPGKPGNSQTSLANIGKAFDNLANSVKCGDHVLIYICGHSGQSGGIQIYNNAGVKTGEELTPTALGNLLDKIDSCPDEDCGTPSKSCHVSVIIESCYAGKFNVPGVTGSGRTVTGSSTDTPAQGIYPGGGVYTAGFVNDLQDPDADTDDPPDGVDPTEAHTSADAAVKADNQNRKTGQETWEDNQWCECKCPCSPGIDVDKGVWYEAGERWVNEIEVELDQLVEFRIEIENDGECRDILDIELIDYLPLCLEPAYQYDPVIYYDGVPHGPRLPDDIIQTESGLQLVWDLDELPPLAPGESIAIEYPAYAVEPGENVNLVFGSAHCAYDYSNVVTDQDTATVWVQEELPPAETVLEGYLYVEYYCECEGTFCINCDVHIDFYAEDISTGDIYPVTSVVLWVNGVKVRDSGPIFVPYYEWSYDIQGAGCGVTYNFTMVATNSIGLTVTVNKSITTPPFCAPQ